VKSQPRAIALVRVAFGLVWLFDASLKWSPTFVDNFTGYLQGAKTGQPVAVRTWLGGWIALLGHDPHLFARLLAGAESLVAVGLILGLLTNAVCVTGGALSLAIWSTAEGFGGPYAPGSTDVGASIIYVLLFAVLAGAGAGATFGLDARLGRRLGRLRWLASAGGPRSAPTTPAATRWRPRMAVAIVSALSLLVVVLGLSVAWHPAGPTPPTMADIPAGAPAPAPAAAVMIPSTSGQDSMDGGGQGTIRH
jgi:thiosulfate dehydrogenase (quinone) large subunit